MSRGHLIQVTCDACGRVAPPSGVDPDGFFAINLGITSATGNHYRVEIDVCGDCAGSKRLRDIELAARKRAGLR